MSAAGALTNAQSSEQANPLDKLSSADVAVHVARLTALPEATAVTNEADTVNAGLEVSAADDRVIAKPQIVSTSLKSKKDVRKYVSVEGDTISTLAAKFGVTSDTIRISNGLSTETIAPGKELTISPVNGVIYTVKDGDTPDSIANTFRANKDQLIAFNDAELSGGFKPGEQVVIPGGSPPARVAARTAGASGSQGSGFAFGDGAVFGGNAYAKGYCTWWAALRRVQVGKPVPSNLGNASSWKPLAGRAGIPTGNVPKQYAVIWTPGGNHVGFVESMNADGSANISEMNAVGWNRVSHRTLSAAEAATYGYIY